jgi:hypothetical protein
MLRKVVLGGLVLVSVLLMIASFKPDFFKVSRSINISAPQDKVFGHVNDLHQWEAWSPWAKLDPHAQNTYEGAASGEGAAMSWKGNNQVGEGRMTITQSRPIEYIQFRLDFEKPFKGTSMAEFSFMTQNDQTIVTWTMSGKNDWIAKVMSVFMNCDKMIGEQFDKGLLQLKSVAESNKNP